MPTQKTQNLLVSILSRVDQSFSPKRVNGRRHRCRWSSIVVGVSLGVARNPAPPHRQSKPSPERHKGLLNYVPLVFPASSKAVVVLQIPRTMSGSGSVQARMVR